MAAFTENEMKDFKITDWYDLSGQVAVVTGGSTGLGLAITRCLVSCLLYTSLSRKTPMPRDMWAYAPWLNT